MGTRRRVERMGKNPKNIYNIYNRPPPDFKEKRNGLRRYNNKTSLYFHCIFGDLGFVKETHILQIKKGTLLPELGTLFPEWGNQFPKWGDPVSRMGGPETGSIFQETVITLLIGFMGV